MTNIQNELGVQSYCFRQFPAHTDVARLARKIGVSVVEICSAHVDFDRPETFEAAIEVYRSADIKIVSIGVERIGTDEAATRKRFEFVQRCGARFMSVDFPPDDAEQCFRMAEKLGDEYNVKLAIHNHGGRHWLGNSQMLAWVFGKTSQRIGLCLDTAWALDAREDPIKMAERFADRLYGIHIKDFTFDRAGKPTDAVVGKGNLALSTLCETLKQAHYDGYAVLEYEGDADNPVPALTQCVDAVKHDG